MVSSLSAAASRKKKDRFRSVGRKKGEEIFPRKPKAVKMFCNRRRRKKETYFGVLFLKHNSFF